MADPRRNGQKGNGNAEVPSEKEAVADLEERLERLRVLFEQYFLGIEKRPPLEKKSEVQRTIRQLQSRRMSGSATRFQFQALVGRFNIFDGYWTRILRQIEDGTYRRDLFRMKLNEEKRAAQERATEDERPAAAPPPYGLSEERMRTVYDTYVQAKRHCGEAVDRLTYDVLRATLLREAPKIAEKNGVSRVDFQVVIRDGKAVLKAVPIRERTG